MLWSILSSFHRFHCNFVQTLCHQHHSLGIRVMPSCSRLLIRSLSSGSNISSIDEKPEAPKADFVHRHIGPSEKDINHMLQFCGFNVSVLVINLDTFFRLLFQLVLSHHQMFYLYYGLLCPYFYFSSKQLC